MNFPLIFPLAGKIAENDPHGLIITVVSVTVVFLSLLILFLAYLLIGKIVRRYEKEQTDPRKKPQTRKTHRNEPRAITIRRKGNTGQLVVSKKTADMTRGIFDIYGDEYESYTQSSSKTEIRPAIEHETDTCSTAAAGTMRSPLPGTILAINVKVGDMVTIGQEVAVLEAMKMENSIESEFEGTVTAIHISQGETVLEGGNIITIG